MCLQSAIHFPSGYTAKLYLPGYWEYVGAMRLSTDELELSSEVMWATPAPQTSEAH